MRFVITNTTRDLGYAGYDWTGIYGSVPDNLTALQRYPWQVLADFARDIRLLQATQAALPFVGNAMAGWDASPWGGEARPIFAAATSSEWLATLAQLREDVAAYGLGFPMQDGKGIVPALSVYAWNEFGEGGIMAPTHGWNVSRLVGLRDTFPKSVL